MEPKDYTVVKIEGEYAYLRADGDGEGDDLFIAMALLPPGVDAERDCITRLMIGGIGWQNLFPRGKCTGQAH